MLVGLRFWNQVDDDGTSFWVFESRSVRLFSLFRCLPFSLLPFSSRTTARASRQRRRLEDVLDRHVLVPGGVDPPPLHRSAQVQPLVPPDRPPRARLQRHEHGRLHLWYVPPSSLAPRDDVLTLRWLTAVRYKIPPPFSSPSQNRFQRVFSPLLAPSPPSLLQRIVLTFLCVPRAGPRLEAEVGDGNGSERNAGSTRRRPRGRRRVDRERDRVVGVQSVLWLGCATCLGGIVVRAARRGGVRTRKRKKVGRTRFDASERCFRGLGERGKNEQGETVRVGLEPLGSAEMRRRPWLSFEKDESFLPLVSRPLFAASKLD